MRDWLALKCQNMRQVLALVVFVATSAAWASPFLETHGSYHQVAVINDGVSAFEKRLSLIENAKSEIDVMVYLFERDQSSRLVMQALMTKARNGARVRVLLDYYTGDGKPGIDDATVVAIYDELVRRGPLKGSFEIRYYNRGTILGSLGRVNHRNHAKMMVTDRSDVLVGGRNIADNYFSMSEGDFDYIDRDMWARGPVAHQAVSAFEAYWSDTKWVSKPRKPKNPPSQSVREFANLALSADEIKLREQIRETAAKAPLRIRHVNNVTLAIDKPSHAKKDRVVTPLLNKIMASADQYLLIENYALPMSDAKLQLLKDVAARNVPVVVLTNSFEAHDLTGVSAYSQTVEAKLLREKNVWIFAYTGGPLPSSLTLEGRKPPKVYSTHTKSLVSISKSGWVAVVGSYNFDVRSEKTNNEVVMVVEDQTVANDVATDIASRTQYAHPLSVGANGRIYYADTQQLQPRVFGDFKSLMQFIGLGKLIRSLY